MAKTKNLDVLRAIRQHCLACCGGSRSEVKFCPVIGCPLWPFRFGSNPSELTKESREYRILLDRKNFKKDAILGPDVPLSKAGKSLKMAETAK